MKPIPSFSAFARLLALGALLVLGAQAFAQSDPLPSWNDGAAKQAIVAFVKDTTDQGSPKYVPPEERIAEFDQDGTLWVEHPVYSQVVFALERVPALVKAKPGLAKVEPFKTVLSGNREAMAKLTFDDLFKVAVAVQSGMTPEAFSAEVNQWLATAKDPRWKRPYTDLVYQPMQEVLKYLRANGYKTFILQTNGVLLNEDWARFLKEHRFLVGLSIDGPRELHDRFRVSKGGVPTFDQVVAAAKLLKRFGVPFNTLTCVHRFNASRPLDVYRFLRRELDSTFLQFIPVVQIKGFETTAPQTWDPARLPVLGRPEARPDHPNSVVTDWSVDPEEYGAFLCKVFDEWYRKDLSKVLVSHFETLVAQHLGLPAQNCIQHEFCGKGVAVEHDGSVYSCDHYVYPEYRLGHLRERPLAEMVFSPAQVKFGYAKAETLPRYCRECAYLRDCWGECPKNRLIRAPDGDRA
jgi:uncharacterized protein